MNTTIKKTLGTIYKISCPNTDKVYIGSTVNPTKRWYKHRYEFKHGNTKACMSKLILEYGNAEFTELAQMKYTDKIELKKMEIEIMKQYEGKYVNNYVNAFSSRDAAVQFHNNKRSKESIKKYNDLKIGVKILCLKCNKEQSYKHFSRHNKTCKILK